MKEFLKFIIILVTLIVGSISVALGVVYWDGTREASSDQYENIKTLIKYHPELKELLQDAMTDGILSRNEYEHIQYVDQVRYDREWDEEQKVKRDRLRSELLETSYEKDKGE